MDQFQGTKPVTGTHAFDTAALQAKVMRYQPRLLAFTSKTAAAAYLQSPTSALRYGLQPQTIGITRIYVLPSPSGQARIFWQPEVWQAMATAALS